MRALGPGQAAEIAFTSTINRQELIERAVFGQAALRSIFKLNYSFLQEENVLQCLKQVYSSQAPMLTYAVPKLLSPLMEQEQPLCFDEVINEEKRTGGWNSASGRFVAILILEMLIRRHERTCEHC